MYNIAIRRSQDQSFRDTGVCLRNNSDLSLSDQEERALKQGGPKVSDIPEKDGDRILILHYENLATDLRKGLLETFGLPCNLFSCVWLEVRNVIA